MRSVSTNGSLWPLHAMARTWLFQFVAERERAPAPPRAGASKGALSRVAEQGAGDRDGYRPPNLETTKQLREQREWNDQQTVASDGNGFQS